MTVKRVGSADLRVGDLYTDATNTGGRDTFIDWVKLVDASGNDLSGAVGGAEYETVAASQTDQALGATGAAGDYLSSLLIVPATTSPGAVSIKDGGGSAITVFTGGASSVSNLVSFTVQIGAKSLAGAWKVTTGASVSVFATGDFT